MKYLLIIITFIVLSCSTANEPSEYKFINIEFKRIDTTKRWDNNRLFLKLYYLYEDDNGGRHRLPVFYGYHSQLLVRE